MVAFAPQVSPPLGLVTRTEGLCGLTTRSAKTLLLRFSTIRLVPVFHGTNSLNVREDDVETRAGVKRYVSSVVPEAPTSVMLKSPAAPDPLAKAVVTIWNGRRVAAPSSPM